MKKANQQFRSLHLLLIAMAFALIALLSMGHVYAAAINETEPNDNMTTANTIIVGDTVYGSTPVKNMGIYDQNYDWFKFNPPVSGNAVVNIWADAYTTKDISEIHCYVYDSSNNRLGEAHDTVTTTGGGNVTFPVTYGNSYYLHIYATDGTGIFTDVSYHYTVGYSIGRTTIKSAKPKKKAFTVSWNKKAKTSFYQVQYIKKSVFQDYSWSKAKVVNVSGKSKTKKVKGLARKKKYYVRVRVARNIAGVTYYSPWSPRKSVKTK